MEKSANTPERQLDYQTVTGRHGTFLANPHDAYIGRSLIEYGEYSERELSLLAGLVKPGAVVVEVGANIGAHTVALAHAVGPSGRIHAFEPQPILFQNLCANLALNGLSRVHAHNAACGANRSELVIRDLDYMVENNFGGITLDTLSQPTGSEGLRILQTTLDASIGGRVDLVKIDAEGMERDVLRGAVRILESYRPLLYVENDRLEQSERLIKTIQSFGYQLWWHCPPLFNPDNYAGKSENFWPNTVSVNMLCAHKSVGFSIPGAREIRDASEHPQGTAQGGLG